MIWRLGGEDPEDGALIPAHRLNRPGIIGIESLPRSFHLAITGTTRRVYSCLGVARVENVRERHVQRFFLLALSMTRLRSTFYYQKDMIREQDACAVQDETCFVMLTHCRSGLQGWIFLEAPNKKCPAVFEFGSPRLDCRGVFTPQLPIARSKRRCVTMGIANVADLGVHEASQILDGSVSNWLSSGFCNTRLPPMWQR